MLFTTASGSSLPSTVMYQSSNAFNRRNHSRTSLPASRTAGLSALLAWGLTGWERALTDPQTSTRTRKKLRLSIRLDTKNTPNVTKRVSYHSLTSIIDPQVRRPPLSAAVRGFEPSLIRVKHVGDHFYAAVRLPF